jgi:predicted AlkP superfamily pyrophosphatase or phosphodiesterase
MLPPLHAASLVVISVDGLDHRYLTQRDKLGLRIPNMRRMLREGVWADGVTGVVPSITWPSHTTIVTGVPPQVHGILGNWRAPMKEKYLSADQIQAPTLWHAAAKQGRKVAAVDWPVTVGASAISFNIPEYFVARQGGGMDLASIEKKSTPGLIDELTKEVPGFATRFLDDRARTLAVVYLLQHKKPDLLLVHLVDHDAEAHEAGPYTREANAILEYTDELIGGILRAVPPGTVVALVSDHGFERVDDVLNIPVLLKQEGVQGEVKASGGLASTSDEKVAAVLRKAGREIPAEEKAKYLPDGAKFLFEPREHVEFGNGTAELHSAPAEKGNHGFWPGREGYRSVFVMWGSGKAAGSIGEIRMESIAGRLAAALGIEWK